MSRIRPLMTDRAVRTAGTACLKRALLLKQNMSFKSTDRLSNRIRLDVIRSNQKIWNAQTSTNQNCLKLGILPSHWLSDEIIDITHKSDDTSHHSYTKIRKLQVIRHSIDIMMLSHILTVPFVHAYHSVVILSFDYTYVHSK